MKTIFTLLLLITLMPSVLSAQPTMTINEFYNTGTVITMVNCSLAGVQAGPSGAAVTWDFSTLEPSGGTTVTSILHDTSSLFSSTCSLMETLPNGTLAYLDETNTDSYFDGIYDTGSHITTSYGNYDVAKRPVTYNTVYIDTYSVNIPATGMYGTGGLRQTGDGYGTLILPTGTYTNVLRVKKVQQENDTSGGAYQYSYAVSYLWFEASQSAPLLRIDSTQNAVTQTQTVMYLASSTGITNVNAPQNVYSSYFDNSGNLVVNGFETGKNYEVVLYNIIGNKMFTAQLSATENTHRFDVYQDLHQGIYIVSITVKSEPSANPATIKVVKNN